RSGRPQAPRADPPAAVFGMGVSPDGKTLAAACFDNAVRLYDLKTRRLVAALEGHKERVWTVAFSPDGKRLASAAGSFSNPEKPGEVKVWDVGARKELLDLPGPEAAAMAVAWSGDRRRIAAGTRDGLARLY